MIKVAYDLTPLAVSPFGGIAQVCNHIFIQAKQSSSVAATGFYKRGNPKNIHASPSELYRLKWYDRYQMSNFDIIHALSHRIPLIRGKRLVYTLHDSWSLHSNRYQPTNFQKKVGRRMIRELQKADAIVAISKTTRSSLLKLGIVDPKKCYVAYNGVTKSSNYDSDNASDLVNQTLKAPFALFVGRIEIRKNLEHVTKAVSQVPNLNLVIVGEPGFGYEEIEQNHLSKFPQKKLIRFRHLSKLDLDILYRNAVCAIIPSWEEGFGLPILEAMVNGCPVITSNRSACAEVGSSGAILVNPETPKQSHEAISRLLEDREYREKMSKVAINRADEFTWEKCFNQLTLIYESVLTGD